MRSQTAASKRAGRPELRIGTWSKVMRQIVLDTETTGLDPTLGDRVIEIGASKLIDRRVTDRRFHHYLNPEREIDAGAIQVHGLTAEFLRTSRSSADIAAEFLDFVRGAELVIHNAPFDVAFLNAELTLIDLERIETAARGIIDTLRSRKICIPASATGWMRCASAIR